MMGQSVGVSVGRSSLQILFMKAFAFKVFLGAHFGQHFGQSNSFFGRTFWAPFWAALWA